MLVIKKQKNIMALSPHPQASHVITEEIVDFCLPPEIFSSTHHLLPLDQFAAPGDYVNIGRLIQHRYLVQSVNIRSLLCWIQSVMRVMVAYTLMSMTTADLSAYCKYNSPKRST